jgi:hypothetical protein
VRVPPIELGLGLFLVLSSGGYLASGLRLTSPVSLVGLTTSILWGVLGLALFVAGTLVYLRGLRHRPARASLALAALAYGLRVAFGAFAYGNPFSSVSALLPGLVTGLGVAADLLLFAAGLWFAVKTLRPGPAETADRGFGQAATVFLAAFVVQLGVVPLINLALYLVADSSPLLALSGPTSLTFLSRLLLKLAKGAAGIIGLLALWTAYSRGILAKSAAWAVGLWAAGDVVYLVSLWLSWSGPSRAIAPPLVAQLRTTLLGALPTLALLGLAVMLGSRKRETG